MPGIALKLRGNQLHGCCEIGGDCDFDVFRLKLTGCKHQHKNDGCKAMRELKHQMDGYAGFDQGPLR